MIVGFHPFVSSDVGVFASLSEEDIGAMPVYASVGVRTCVGIHWLNEDIRESRDHFQMRLLLVALLMLVSTPPAHGPSTPVAFSCPVTLPATNLRPAESDLFGENEPVHYENSIWVSIPEGGILELFPDQSITFGPLAGWRSTTVTWLRDDGVEGFVIVSGQRLDEPSDLSPQTPLSPQRQYVTVGTVKTGLAFPSEGCWEVTGTVASPLEGDDPSITWVVEVRFVEQPMATTESK